MNTASEIRQQFLDFFRSKQHQIVPSAPIVIKNDPTLLFTNAGMNQFKDYFLGNKTAAYHRVADTQKCLRVSGKHNDLEEVGVDTYHHTMFEMLGNWSFGDPTDSEKGYFKKEAIAWSWELLTEVYKIPKENLYVTIFEGDEKEGIAKDVEALEEWKKYTTPDRILLGNKKDNFWEMGDTGPCGPCTEIHVDCRLNEEKKLVPGAALINKDHPQVIEIWNNVFIQYNRTKNGSLQPLPAKHVDTGMGFERLVRVLQNKNSNYDTDVFSGTIAEIEKITSKKYQPQLTIAHSKKNNPSAPAAGSWEEAVAFRVLADHIRAICFTIADGQLPANNGAGYVIRRILRRAVRYYYSYLNYQQPLLYQLLPVIARQFKDVFPEVEKNQTFIGKVIKEEEEAFLRTLDKGLKRIALLMQSDSKKEISGVNAFELLDTFGFPIDLTRLIAQENSFVVDEAGFEEEMNKQKNRSRNAAVLQTDDWTVLNPSNSKGFVGYQQLQTQTKILKYRKVSAKGKDSYQLVLEETPFYAESGGQVGDTGTLKINDEEIIIYDTKKENDLIIHYSSSLPKAISENVAATVTAARRKSISIHHSVTHLMHAALQQVLGSHVAQKGSLVTQDYLRFDFSHFSKMTANEIEAVEHLVNEKIRANLPVVIKILPKDEALKMGAMALFGEKYGDMVRVVTMDENYSVELCGGTHVGFTGEIGLFKITSESAVAAGVRRIEAVSGAAAFAWVQENFKALQETKDLLKNPPHLTKAISHILEENHTLSKKIAALEARQLVGIRNELLKKDSIINNVNFIADVVEVPNADALKKLCFDFKNHLSDYVIVLCSNIAGKAFVAIAVSKTVVAAKNLDAAQLIKTIVGPAINGGGGGQKELATAGGTQTQHFNEIIEAIKQEIKPA